MMEVKEIEAVLMQLEIFHIQPHQIENNSVSQALLEECKPQIIKSCQKVLDILKNVDYLTVKDAVKLYDISSLPRRALDLIENGIDVKRELVGRVTHYYLTKEEKERLRGMV